MSGIVLLAPYPDLILALPEISLLVLGLVLVAVDIVSRKARIILPWITLAGVSLTALFLADSAGGTAFGGMFISDAYSSFVKIVVLAGVAFTTLISDRYLDTEDMRHGEYYGLMVFSALGMFIMASAADLIVLYLGLELMAFSVYCLVALLKQDPRSSEAAVKYFLMGAFSSAILLYGISLLYGMTGTTDLLAIADAMSAYGLTHNPAALAAVGCILIAFSFKVAAVPFHFWTPDAYEGAPTPITAFMSVGPKVAGFAVLGRVFFTSFYDVEAQWAPLIGVIAFLTMGIGNIVALSQTSIKRMLAYSAIAHAGYALLGVVAGTDEGLSASLNYLLLYTFMNMGAFGILILLCGPGERRETLDDYRGLAKNHPMAAALMLLFMFSLTGIPPTAGFIGKFYLFVSALKEGHTFLVISACIFSAISAFFYLRVVRLMYMEEPDKSFPLSLSPALSVALLIAAVGVIGLGIAPGPVLDMAGSAIMGFMR